MTDLAQRLTEDFRDREYRESYAEELLNRWISQQLAVVRRQRGKTQQQLAGDVGTKQSGISRMEREDYGRWNFATLQKVAFALGCRLKVSLETYGTLVEEAAQFSEARLRRPSFDEDPVFHEGTLSDSDLGEPGPLREIRRKFIPWLWSTGPLERLEEWLQGYNLPLAGDETPPSEWLWRALLPGDERLKDTLADQVSRFILEARWNKAKSEKHKAKVVENVFALAERLRRPSILGQSLWTSYRRRADIPFPGSEAPGPEHPLIRALTYNQPVEFFSDLWSLWRSLFLAEREVREMPDYVAAGLIGVSWLSDAPNVLGIVQGANQAKRWSLPLRQITDILERGFSRLWLEFPEKTTLKENVIRMAGALPDGWSQPIITAWYRSVADQLPVTGAQGADYMTQVVKSAYLKADKEVALAVQLLAA